MPGPRARGLRMERPGAVGRRAIKRRRACLSEARKRQAWACPAERESAKQGRADGSSACPGGSPFEPGGVSTKATIPGDMQQTGQIHPRAERWRQTSSAAGSALKWAGPLPVCPKSMRDARIVTVRAPRARFSPSRSARPFRGKRNKDDRQALGPDEHGAMTRVRNRSPDKRSAIRG
jgi:hypothetical protein